MRKILLHPELAGQRARNVNEACVSQPTHLLLKDVIFNPKLILSELNYCILIPEMQILFA